MQKIKSFKHLKYEFWLPFFLKGLVKLLWSDNFFVTASIYNRTTYGTILLSRYKASKWRTCLNVKVNFSRAVDYE